ncbi:MAG: SGNH/GDSL hydrolase family protein [Chloroflexi bacterium]|nr:SGNH/GDSL hydrolase family protein [Chloroflexota bacterium]
MTASPSAIPSTIRAPARRRTRQLLAARALVVLFSLLMPILLLEASLRLLGPWLPGGYDTGPYIVRHELLGHFHAPNHRGWMRAPEFTTYVQISPLGLRDRRTSYEKPPGTFRVLLLGDSFLEGVQVQQWEGVAERLETALNQWSMQAGGPRVEVINAGVAAYGTAQYLLLFEHDAHRYQPDLVMVLHFVGNDVKNNSPALEIPGGDRRLALKPYFELQADGRLTLLPGPPVTPHSPLVTMMRRSWTYNVFEGSVRTFFDPSYIREDIEVIGGARNYIRENYDLHPEGDWAKAWTLTEALFARLKLRAGEHGAPLVLVGVPDWRALDPVQWRQELFRNRSQRRPASPEAPTDRLGQIARRLELPYVDLLPAMRTASATNGAPLYYAVDGHWNAAGHATAARALGEAIEHGGYIHP